VVALITFFFKKNAKVKKKNSTKGKEGLPGLPFLKKKPQINCGSKDVDGSPSLELRATFF